MARVSAISLQVFPPEALYDVPLTIIISGLPPKATCTIVARCKLTDDDVGYASHAHFVANSSGIVDLNSDECVGGSYLGVDPMGLVVGLKSQLFSFANDNSNVQALVHQRKLEDPKKAFPIHFSIFEGHVTSASGAGASMASLADTAVTRLVMSPTLKRVQIREGRIRGTLFTPKDPGASLPGVLLIGGYNPGELYETRASLVASKGFVALVLAYADYEGLPGRWKIGFEFEYFIEAITWLHSLPQVKKCGIALVGSCFGAPICHMLSTQCPELVRSVVTINGPSVVFDTKMTYRGKLVSDITTVRTIIDDVEYHVLPIHEAEAIPIETSAPGTRFLFIVGEADLATSPEHSLLLSRRLKQAGRQDHYKIVSYPDVGHIFRPPYSPAVTMSPKPDGKAVSFGGIPEAINKASVLAWKELVDFLLKTAAVPAHSAKL